MGSSNSGQMIYGEVAPDPTATPQVGDTVRFQPVTIKLLDDDRTVFMEDAGAFDGVLLSLHFADDDEHLVHGSAVLVGPGIALTAKHVIEPYLEVLAAGHKHSMCIGIAQNPDGHPNCPTCGHSNCSTWPG